MAEVKMKISNSLSEQMVDLLDCLPINNGDNAVVQGGIVYLDQEKLLDKNEAFAVVKLGDYYVVKALNSEELLYGYKVDRIEPAMYPMDKSVLDDGEYQLRFCSAFRKHLPPSSNCKDRIKQLDVVE